MRARLLGLKQPHILDRDHGLVGKNLDSSPINDGSPHYPAAIYRPYVEAEVRVSISEIADLEVDGAAPLEQLLLAILSTLTDAVEASTLAKAREKLST